METEPMSSYSAYLRGLSFRPIEAKVIAGNLIEGSPLTLMREPDNQFDPNAIMVLCPDTQVHLGYVAKEVAVDLAGDMDAGIEFQCHVSANMMKSILLDIEPVSEKIDWSKIKHHSSGEDDPSTQ
jgi:hypothetical protein